MDDVTEEWIQEVGALPLAWDERYNIAICTDCYIGLPFDWIANHMKDNHGLKCNDNGILDCLGIAEPTMKANEAKVWLNQHKRIVNPISQIPVQDGFGCSICSYSARKKAALYNHISKNHRNAIAAATIVEQRVQKPFASHLKKCIIVNPIDDEEAVDIPGWRVTLKERFNQAMAKLRQGKNTGSVDLRLVNAFIAKMRLYGRYCI